MKFSPWLVPTDEMQGPILTIFEATKREHSLQTFPLQEVHDMPDTSTSRMEDSSCLEEPRPPDAGPTVLS